MKKLAVGCGLLILVIGVLAGGLMYYAYQRVSSAVVEISELGQVVEIERDVRNRGPFTPPSSALLTARQVEQLVQVQERIRRRVGEEMKAFEAKYRQLSRTENPSLEDASVLLQAYGDLAAAWIDAKRAQVEALNAVDLSLAEYRWIRDQAYQAIGAAFVDLDVAKLVDDVRRGATASDPVGQLKGALQSTGPEANRRLVERVKKVLEENLALAAFGL